MGYLEQKYTKEYFLKIDKDGNPSNIGVEGAELFKMGVGELRSIDNDILKRLDFSGKKVLEFGFGRGEALKYAKEHGARLVVGVDFSKSAYDIAKEYLSKCKCDVDLYCKDAYDFLRIDVAQNYVNESFDIVIMLDFVEHVPRQELTEIFMQLHHYLSAKAIVAINTPIFNIDNDVIREGLKREAVDSSDLNDETKGMHCNRYTLESLKEYMSAVGFFPISGHFYASSIKSHNFSNLKFFEIISALQSDGYPLMTNESDEIYESAIIPDDKIALVSKQYYPIWMKIKSGLLSNRELYIDIKDQNWQKEMIEGNFDPYFFEFLSTLDLNGKTIIDVGAHIGYLSMCFAELVGPSGKVYSFEPNIYNIERMNLILSRNSDLRTRISIIEAALSNENGKVFFHFSPNIDSGLSSGSFVQGADTPYEEAHYDFLQFERVEVESITLDAALENKIVGSVPDIIKVDVEGAEMIVLNGALKTIAKYKPTFLVELHSIKNIINVFTFFYSMQYSVKVLSEESEHRTFVVAEYLKEATHDNPKEFIEKINYFALKAIENRDLLVSKYIASIKQLESKNVELSESKSLLKNNYDQLSVMYHGVVDELNRVQSEHNNLSGNHEALSSRHEALRDIYDRSLDQKLKKRVEKHPFIYRPLRFILKKVL